MNSSPMIRRFSSGSSTPAKPGEEALAGVDHDEVHPEVSLEGDAQEPRLLLAHEAVVDVDAGQPVPDGAMDERRRHGRSTPPDSARSLRPSEPVSRACASTRSRMPVTACR
jgi:hypothetical protein